MKFWVTKYALTKGIFEVEATECMDIGDKPMNMIRVQGGSGRTYYHCEGRDFHRTEMGALNRALEMGSKKIKALHKNINTLECKQAQLRNSREALSRKA